MSTDLMHLCVFEDDAVPGLRPLVETRAVYDLRVGVRTILETILDAFTSPNGSSLILHTRHDVAAVTKEAHDDALMNELPENTDILFVNGRFVTTNDPARAHINEYVQTSSEPRIFTQNDHIVAAWVPNASTVLPAEILSEPEFPTGAFSSLPTTSLAEASLVSRPWDLLDTLRPCLHHGAASLPAPPSTSLSERAHASVHESVVGVQPDQIRLGTGATIRPGAILHADEGPIVVGRNATIGERTVIRGPCYIGPKSQIKVGANLRAAAFGYYCKVGGEVHNTIIHSLSNKPHPGFLGHAYVGRWCNLGADTNCSNLRNDYGEISSYAPAEGDFVPTGRQFAGLFMGDHSKCGINTMFNTGTVVGTFCNLYGGDYLPRYVPPFSWGGPARGFTTYRLSKALSVAERVMARRDVELTNPDRTLLSTLYEKTESERTVHHQQ